MAKPVASTAWTLTECQNALRLLLEATAAQEAAVAAQDLEISKIQAKHAPKIARFSSQIETLHEELEAYYRANRAKLETEGRKSVKLSYGVIGMRSSGNPALVPLNAKWDWKKIAAKVRAVWKSRYFHDPKPPELDKVKLKSELKPDQLAKCGLKLEAAEAFYIDLDRPNVPEAA